MIREAAAVLFAEHGFPAASMARLAEASGVSKPLLYHYYRDKSDLLFDIADSYIERLLGIVAAVEGEGLAPELHLRTLIARFMEEYEHSQARHRVLVQDVKFLDQAARATVLAKQRAVVEAFATAIARNRPRWPDAGHRVPLAMILFGMINWTFTWLRADGPLAYADMAELVADIFLRGAAPPGPRS
jgi:AcrR family transcriptional regulator